MRRAKLFLAFCVQNRSDSAPPKSQRPISWPLPRSDRPATAELILAQQLQSLPWFAVCYAVHLNIGTSRAIQDAVGGRHGTRRQRIGQQLRTSYRTQRLA